MISAQESRVTSSTEYFELGAVRTSSTEYFELGAVVPKSKHSVEDVRSFFLERFFSSTGW